MTDKVSILKRDGTVYYYTSYSNARAAAVSKDLIQIWANLDERILLLDEVDIWIAPGVTLNRTGATPTIIDNVSGTYTDPVKCKIYGYGIIKNSYENISNPNDRYECIKTINGSTELEVECDYVKGIGGLTTNIIIAPSIFIENAKKFHLNCNQVINNKTCAIALGLRPNLVQNHIDDVNIKVQKVEIDLPDITNSESIAVSTLATGFIEIDEIICRHYGHCLLHARGNITATIRKMTSVNNVINKYATVIVSHGDGSSNQNLILYFDEILASSGNEQESGPGLLITQGIIVLLGRRIHSIDVEAISITGINTKGYIKCLDIVCENLNAMTLNDFTTQITIDAINIIGKGGGDYAVIFSYDSAKFVIKNAQIRNKNDGSSVYGMKLIKNPSGGSPQVTFNNAKIISNGQLISYNISSPLLNIKNYALFGNKDIANNLVLQIGDFNNYVFVYSSDLT